MIHTLLALILFAHAELSAFEQALKNEGFARTQERWVEFGGTMYREVEYQNGKYYVKFTGRQGEFAELDCRVPDGKPNMIQTAISVMRRTRLFVSFLTENCKLDEHGKARTSIALDPRIGFTIPDDPHFPVKDRSIFWPPALGPLGIGAGGNW